MSFFEDELIKKVSVRFRELRGSRQIETISYGQKSTIKRIESGKNIKSGNFIPDSLLEDYSRIFKIKKDRLIFGTDNEIADLLESTFYNYFQEILLNRKVSGNLCEFNRSFIDYLCIFAEFSTWYNFNFNKKCSLLFFTPWIIIKRRLVSSFKHYVIEVIFNDEGQSFKFVEINRQFHRWLEFELANFFFPEIIELLKKDTIFKIGYMVNTLAKEFIEYDLPTLNDDSIPFNYLRLKTHISPITVKLKIDEKYRTILKRIHPNKDNKDNKDNKVGMKELVPVYKILNRNEFLDHVKNNSIKFGGKVPGILKINSKASKFVQLELNDLFLNEIKTLTKYQSYLLNLIRYQELEDFL